MGNRTKRTDDARERLQRAEEERQQMLAANQRIERWNAALADALPRPTFADALRTIVRPAPRLRRLGETMSFLDWPSELERVLGGFRLRTHQACEESRMGGGNVRRRPDGAPIGSATPRPFTPKN
jgi:hypothetical protein